MSPTWCRPGHEFDAGATHSLTAHAYANNEVFVEELHRLFAPASGMVYEGHDLFIPSTGHRRSDADPRLLLTRDNGEVHVLANV